MANSWQQKPAITLIKPKAHSGGPLNNITQPMVASVVGKPTVRGTDINNNVQPRPGAKFATTTVVPSSATVLIEISAAISGVQPKRRRAAVGSGIR